MPTRPNAGFRDGKTIRRWTTYAMPPSDDDTVVNKELFPRPPGQATETSIAPDPVFAPVDNSRPDLPDENADGLDPLTEEVIRQAEDITTGSDERPPGLDDTTVEPREAIENQGEFPGLADQGDESPNPRKRRRKS
ncbi:MAG: hypothetical protein JNL04_18805 [Rhodospirillaceae bacterium]|nr:hypothetical protein [Rhodospirillaceae bacterium]